MARHENPFVLIDTILEFGSRENTDTLFCCIVPHQFHAKREIANPRWVFVVLRSIKKGILCAVCLF